MKENSLWFRHDANASTDGKLLLLRSRHGLEGLGAFWFLLEHMYQNEGYLSHEVIDVLLAGVANAKQVLQSCLAIGMFKETKDGRLYAERLLEEIGRREHIIEKRRAAGRKGGLHSAKKRVVANAQPNGAANVKRVEERREEKNRGEKKDSSSTKKGPRPSVEMVMKTMHECFGTLDRSEAENRRYAWLLIQRAVKGPPAASEDRAAGLCVTLIQAARKSDWWGDRITCVADVYRNARKIVASLRDQEDAKAVFIS